ESVKRPLAFVQNQIQEYKSESKLIKHTPLFVPAGQSTQMVIGATPETDLEIMNIAKTFYDDYKLKRDYYSGYIPINTENSLLPHVGSKAPLVRANRLYRTAWLLRCYDSSIDDIQDPKHLHLDLHIDPKFIWALRTPQFLPVDINQADY